MFKKPYFLFLLVLLCGLSPVRARQIDSSQAREIAAGFFGEESSSQTKRQIKRVRATSEDSPYYIFTSPNKGFVIVSGDDEMKPIVGYSTSGDCDFTDIAPQLEGFLEAYSATVGLMREKSYSVPSTAGGDAVEPLLTTKWDQDNPYNIFWQGWGTQLPPTGCVATAMAQVMKYYNFPPQPKGISYKGWDRYGFESTPYDWANMLDTYQDGMWTDAQARAVSNLMRDAGMAVNMQYSTSGSGALSYDIAPALIRNFNYSEDVRYLLRDSYSTQEWIDIIRENLVKGQPILYGGVSSNGGHQFVCDGIDSDDLLHINWGWSGHSDGYFDVNVLAPSDIGIGGGTGNYKTGHDMVVDIRPGDPEADNTQYANRLLVYNMYSTTSDIGEDGRIEGTRFSISFSILNTIHQSAGPYVIYYRAFDKNTDRPVEKLIEPISGRVGALRADNRYEIPTTLDIRTLTDGEYYLRPVFKESYSSTYEYEMAFDGKSFVYVTIKDGVVYLPDALDAGDRVNVYDVRQDGPLYEGFTGVVKVYVGNEGKRQLDQYAKIDAYVLSGDTEVDNPDIEKLTQLRSLNCDQLYAGSSRWLDWTVGPASNKDTLLPGKYRLYFYSGNKQIAADKRFYIEVSALPDDRPIVFVSELTPYWSTFENVDNIYQEIEFNYIAPRNYWRWFDAAHDFRLIASYEGNQDDEFVLMAVKDKFLWTGSGVLTANLEGVPNLLWRTPGDYHIRLQYKDESDGIWMDINDPMNKGVIHVVENEPLGPVVKLASPLIINDGQPVVGGYMVEINARIMSPTGITIVDEYSHVRLTDDHMVNYSPAGNVTEMSFGKTTLAPGEETDLNMKAFIHADPENFGKKFYIMIYVGNYETYNTLMNPGDYKDSIYFTVIDPAGVENISIDSADVITKVYNLSGIYVGDSTDRLAPGIYIVRQGDRVNKVIK